MSRSPTAVWSITRRLTLLYVASTATLLVMVAGFLYWTLKRNLDHTRCGMLASKVEVLRRLLREQPEHAKVLENEVEHEAAEGQPLRYYIRILDAKDHVLIETPGMNQLAVALSFPPPVEAPHDLRQGLQGHSRQQGAFLLLAAKAPVGLAGGEQHLLQLAMDTSTGIALLADYRNKLLIVLGLGLVFTAVAGGWIARKGMRPLAEIAQAASQITASHLHGPIGRTDWPVELSELAAAFDAMLNRLEDSFTRLSQFSADLAHALRTPIHNLRGEAEVALACDRPPEEYQRILASSLEECDRLSRMINSLLFLARADDPQTILEHVRFNARNEMDAVREFYEALACEQDVTVECEGDAWMTGDPMLVRRALSNLLGNALRHTPRGGSIRISASAPPGRNIEIRVQDTGCGISPENLPKIFGRFFRVGESQSPVPGGSGLGLAIVQSIMRLHGGIASARSVPGEGTVMSLSFPAEAPAAAVGKMTEL